MESARGDDFLLFDNFSAQNRVESLLQLENVKILYLSPIATPKIQPCDTGIISSLKVLYRRYQMERAIELCEEVNAVVCGLDVLSEMLVLQQIWEELPSSMMESCWEYSGLCNVRQRLTEVF